MTSKQSINTHIWVRAEQRPLEQRVGLTPAGVATLQKQGFTVTVEESAARAIPISAYAETGCQIAKADGWQQAPDEAIIFGLKELNEDGPDLRHRHIMFGHAYKGQADGPALLNRFKRGGGKLYDLEYLIDENGKRIAAFGYWAGFAGAAVGVMTWICQQAGSVEGPANVGIYKSKDALVTELKSSIAAIDINHSQSPSVIIIGAKGRVGTGAADFAAAIGLSVTKWDIEETAHGGPFPEILTHNIFVNCILANPNVPVFVPKSAIEANRKLTVIADVSCDPSSEYNPIPIYHASHTFSDPVARVSKQMPPLDVTAIDNLPSMLPVESSTDYADQLLPFLMQLDKIEHGVWGRSEQTFIHHINQL